MHFIEGIFKPLFKSPLGFQLWTGWLLALSWSWVLLDASRFNIFTHLFASVFYLYLFCLPLFFATCYYLFPLRNECKCMAYTKFTCIPLCISELNTIVFIMPPDTVLASSPGSAWHGTEPCIFSWREGRLV